MKRIGNWLHSLDKIALVVAILFVTASLTPSLIPRDAILQGVLVGASAALGYAAGFILHQVWTYLELPTPSQARGRMGFALAVAAAGILATISAWTWSSWQDSLRESMCMTPIGAGRWLLGTITALGICVVLVVLGQLFLALWRAIASRLRRFVPRRIVNVLAGALALWLVWTVANVSIFSWLMRTADDTYAALDGAAGIEIAQPLESWKTGSPASLVDWGRIGRTGREYLTSGPSRDELVSYGLKHAWEPIRIYVGLRSADSVELRAELALRELIRVGAFERSVLVVATPTGTGWLDPSAVDSLEYLHAGNVATVAMQYSYLASWMSLFFEPEYGANSARALFSAVYGHWSEMPQTSRPRLYLFGLSLGALSSERATHLYEVLEDPHDGAVWVGPPFASTIWRAVTSAREDGSPPWLPRFGDGSIVRFTAQANALAEFEEDWGPMRVVYLQYASDPIVFFEPLMFFRKPDWLKSPRGPDVSPSLRWYPVITALQVGIDIILATEVPRGFGHHYAAANYVDAWITVTEPSDWTDDTVMALKQWFHQREANKLLR